MNVIKSLVQIYCLNAIFVFLFKRRFEETIPLAFGSGMLLLYVFSIVARISIGYYILWVISFAAVVLLVYTFIKDKDRFNTFKNNYLTFGFLVFFLGYCFLYLYTFKMSFSFVDEYQHWGVMVREMVRLDRIYSIDASVLSIHKDYPPIISMVETWWCCLFNGFMEKRCYLGLFAFELSLIMPVFSKIESKDNVQKILKAFLIATIYVSACLSIDLLDASDNASVLNSIYADWPMACVCAYSFYCIYSLDDCSHYSLFSIGLSLSLLVLTKQMGLPLFLLMLFYLVIRCFSDKRTRDRSVKLKLFITVLVPVLFLLSWNHYVVINQLESQFSVSAINIRDLISVANNTHQNGWMHEAYSNYLSALFSKNLMIRPFKMTYFIIVIIQTLLMGIAEALANKEKGFIAAPLVYFLGSVGYSIAMLLLYVFCFDEIEGPALACFNRYMLTYIFIGMLILFHICVHYISKSSNYLISVLMVCLFIVFINFSSIDSRILTTRDARYLNRLYSYNEDTLHGKILIVDQYGIDKPWTYKQRELFYHFGHDEDTEYEHLSFWEDGGVNELKMTFDEFKEKLYEYDYLVAYPYYNNAFYDNYWSLLSDSDLINKQLYKINKEGELSFEPVEIISSY